MSTVVSNRDLTGRAIGAERRRHHPNAVEPLRPIRVGCADPGGLFDDRPGFLLGHGSVERPVDDLPDQLRLRDLAIGGQGREPLVLLLGDVRTF
jgi:hypothetical protein